MESEETTTIPAFLPTRDGSDPKWREALQLAPDVKTVEGIMRHYVHALGPVALGKLPPECQRALRGMLEVQGAAVILLRCELGFRGPDEAGALLRDIALTFASAALRMTQLQTNPAP
jgi:hypothetical protein